MPKRLEPDVENAIRQLPQAAALLIANGAVLILFDVLEFIIRAGSGRLMDIAFAVATLIGGAALIASGIFMLLKGRDLMLYFAGRRSERQHGRE